MIKYGEETLTCSVVYFKLSEERERKARRGVGEVCQGAYEVDRPWRLAKTGKRSYWVEEMTWAKVGRQKANNMFE